MKLARQILSMSILILMVAWFVADMLIFPDAPIKLCEANAPYFYSNHPYGYCGKQGQSHTAIDFHNFNIWQNGLLLIWPSGILFISLLKEDRTRAKSGANNQRQFRR